MPLLTGNDDVRSNRQGVILLAGNFTIGSSSAVSSQDFPGVTVTKKGTATWTITCDEAFAKLLACSFIIYQQGSPADVHVQRNSTYSSTTGAVDIATVDTSTPSDTELQSGDVIDCILVMQPTTAGL